MNLQNRKRFTFTAQRSKSSLVIVRVFLKKQTYGCQEEETVGDFRKVMYTLLYLKWITNKDLLYSTCNSTQCYVPAWMGRVWGTMDTCICMAKSPHCPPETITTLLI